MLISLNPHIILNAKPNAFARVEKMIFNQMINPIAPFGAAVMSSVATEKTYSNKVLELV